MKIIMAVLGGVIGFSLGLAVATTDHPKALDLQAAIDSGGLVIDNVVDGSYACDERQDYCLQNTWKANDLQPARATIQ